MTDSQQQAPRGAVKRVWARFLTKQRLLWSLSLTASGGLTVFLFLVFWDVRLWGPLAWIERDLYSWGGATMVILIFFILKLPRLATQRSGDEWIVISENLLTVFSLLLIAFIAGRASTNEVQFPSGGQFIFWLITSVLFVILIVQLYFSMRLAERTGEFGFTPPH